jgi:hypothetical protein
MLDLFAIWRTNFNKAMSESGPGAVRRPSRPGTPCGDSESGPDSDSDPRARARQNDLRVDPADSARDSAQTRRAARGDRAGAGAVTPGTVAAGPLDRRGTRAAGELES